MSSFHSVTRIDKTGRRNQKNIYIQSVWSSSAFGRGKSWITQHLTNLNTVNETMCVKPNNLNITLNEAEMLLHTKKYEYTPLTPSSSLNEHRRNIWEKKEDNNGY